MANEDLGTALHFQLEGINLDDDEFMAKGFSLQCLKVFFRHRILSSFNDETQSGDNVNNKRELTIAVAYLTFFPAMQLN
jgi:hypothetical protein